MNAGSGHSDTNETQTTIREVFDRAGRRHELLLAEKGSDIPGLALRAVELAKAQDGIVVAAGGDGTINAVAQAALGCGQPFAVLPQGTFNYFGREHGISQDTRIATEALLTATPQSVQVGLVNDRLFLVNASLGLYPQLLEDREAFKQRFGRSRLIAGVAGLVSVLRNRRQLNLEIEAEGQTRKIRTPTLFVGNNALQLKQIGIAEGAALAHDHLVAIAPKPVRTLAMIGLMLRGAFGRLGDAEHVISVPLRKLTVRPHRRSRRKSYKVAMDGEVTRLSVPVVFSVSPTPLLLMVPLTPATEDSAA